MGDAVYTTTSGTGLSFDAAYQGMTPQQMCYYQLNESPICFPPQQETNYMSDFFCIVGGVVVIGLCLSLVVGAVMTAIATWEHEDKIKSLGEEIIKLKSVRKAKK